MTFSYKFFRLQNWTERQAMIKVYKFRFKVVINFAYFNALFWLSLYNFFCAVNEALTWQGRIYLRFSREGGGGLSKVFLKKFVDYSFRSTKLIFRMLPEHYNNPILTEYFWPQVKIFWKSRSKLPVFSALAPFHNQYILALKAPSEKL